MKNITLVGADHLISINSVLGERKLEVLPPPGFVRSLDVNDGDSVALEMSPTYRSFEPYGDIDDWDLYNVLMNIKGYGLFKDLSTEFSNLGAVVHDIEDDVMVLGSLGRLIKAQRSLDRLERQGRWPSDTLMRRYNTAAAYAEMVNAVLKDQGFAEKIAQIDPTFIVVSTAHADAMFDAITSKKDGGVTIKDYFRVTPDTAQFSPYMSDAVPSVVQLQSAYTVQQRRRYLDVERELARRKYYAYRYGRLTEKRDKNVAFVGMFDHDLPEEKLFELIITDRNGQEIKGMVRDHLGDADIEGRADKEGMLYKKTYRPNTVLDPGQFSVVTYEGSYKHADRIEGSYRFKEKGAIGGSFVMEVPLTRGTINQVRELRQGYRAAAHAKADRQLWQRLAEVQAAPSRKVKPRR